MNDACQNRRCRRAAWLALMAVALVGAGCTQGPPPTLYLLDSTQDEPLPGAERGVVVGIEPIELPSYLDRPHIVTRRTTNQLRISDSNQWAEPLKAGVTRELVVNLALALDTNRVYALPQRQRTPLDFRVTIDIARFDGTASGLAVLAARWTLSSGAGDRVLVTKVSEIEVAAHGESYEDLVVAMSTALSTLSTRIAEEVRRQR